MRSLFLLRLSYLFLLFAAVLWLPAGVVALFFVLAIGRWTHFYEALAPALLSDLIWQAPSLNGWPFPFSTTILVLVAVYLINELRPRLTWL